MTPAQLLIAFAKLLPDLVHMDRAGQHLRWKDSCREVRETEYAHLVSLAEAKLTEEEQIKYARQLRSDAAKWSTETLDEHYFPVITATPPQRITALCAVHGITMEVEA